MSDHATTLSEQGAALDGAYTQLWASFAAALQAHAGCARAWASNTDEPLHAVLRAAYWTPKHFLQEGTKVGGANVNVGSATGLFFEHLAATLIGARLGRQVGGVELNRNRRGTYVAAEGVPQQPDLFVHNPATGRAAVFEFKAAPKSGDIAAVRVQRARWASSEVSFFFVGGLASPGVVQSLDAEWATFLRTDVNGPDLACAGRPTVDDLVDAAAASL